mgnify:CR=1 FL=1
MKRMEQLKNSATFKQMCDDFLSTTAIDPSLPGKFGVKRGLRNSDGSGVVAGITNVCCVHGYVISECDKQPIEGELIYRGYNIRDIVNDVLSSGRYGYEEVAYLLLFGMLPDERQLTTFSRLIAEYRDLPMYFSEDVIIRNPSPNIMNKMVYYSGEELMLLRDSKYIIRRDTDKFREFLRKWRVRCSCLTRQWKDFWQ